MRKILERALSAVKPTDEEVCFEQAFAQMLVKHVQEHAPKKCLVVLAGSIAKKTFLRDKKDIDIFVLFDRSLPKEDLEPFIKAIMEESFPHVGYQLSYAEHPYVRFHFEGRKIDLVPAYKITKASERVSAVDRSVLHSKFVQRSLKKKQIDDVLLLKQFLRANSFYGAEIKIAGFSGYLCELLIISHGGFVKLLRAASKWSARSSIFLDIKKYYKKTKNQKRNKKEINRSRAMEGSIEFALEHFGSLFVVVDPTDQNRNVAAAVSPENLARFISLSKRFLKAPSDVFFFRKPETFEDRTKKASRGKKLILVSMPRPEIVDDVLWGQLHKMTGQLEAHLSEFKPKIIADDSRHLVRLAIVLERDRLPKKMLIAGPPLEMAKHVASFKKSHKKAKFIIKKGKLFAEADRPIIGAEDSIRSFFLSFSKTKSHLAYPEEMIVLEKGDSVLKKR